MYAALFYFIAGLTVIGALGVALSTNVVYSAISLLLALCGASGLYVFLAADFVAVVQILVYVGGILILTLFAILRAPWHVEPLADATPTTYGIGDSFLNQYLLPFELASVVLLTALVGAIVLSRKELRE